MKAERDKGDRRTRKKDEMRNRKWRRLSVKAGKQWESETERYRKSGLLLRSSVKVNSLVSPQKARLTAAALCTCFSTRAWLSRFFCFDVAQRQKESKKTHRWLKPKSSNFWKGSAVSELSLLKSQDRHLLNVSATAKPADVCAWESLCTYYKGRQSETKKTAATRITVLLLFDTGCVTMHT